MRKKLLSFALTGVMALSILAGVPTGTKNANNVWAASSVDASESEDQAGSSVLTVYSYNIEVDDFVQNFKQKYPTYKDKIKFVNFGMGGSSEEYTEEVDKILADTKNTSVVFMDIGLVDSMLNKSAFSSMSKVGITNSDYASAYEYTKELGSYNGQLKFLAPCVEPSAFLYNKAIAEKVLGTSDPEKVQQYMSTPAKYLETAEKMKKAGYYMSTGIKSMAETVTNYGNICSDEAGLSNIVNVSLAKGYDTKHDTWTAAWDTDITSGKVFCMLSCTWFTNFSLPEKAQNMYRCCEGPISYCWGGNFVGVANAGASAAQTSVAKEFLKYICCNANDMSDLSIARATIPNNTMAVQKMITGGYGKNPIVGSQDVMKIYDKTAKKVRVSKEPGVKYTTHVQSIGWQNEMVSGDMAGTIGLGKRLEGIKISLSGVQNLGVQYTTHVQSYGWLPWVSNGEMSGTEGEAKRLEAIMIKLTGANASKYDIYYRVHAQSYGWLGWAKNGEPAGTAGYGKRLEAIQIVLVAKGTKVANSYKGITSSNAKAYVSATSGTPSVGGASNTNVMYRTHVQTYGWQGWKYNGQMSGTSGQAKRLESINISLSNKQCAGGITYRTHVQSIGWQDWRSNGAMSGTSGMAKRLEAIEIKLTGEMANQYDVYYRVHAQSFGWLAWAKNGQSSGTAGLAKRLEGIQIVLVKKGGKAPANVGGIQSVRKEPYIKK